MTIKLILVGSAIIMVLMAFVFLGAKKPNKVEVVKEAAKEPSPDDIIGIGSLSIPNTINTEIDPAIMAQYGIDFDNVLAVGYFAQENASIEDVPDSISSTLANLMHFGSLRGADAALFTTGKSVLSPSQKIYFVLTGKNKKRSELSILGFIHP